MQKVRSFAVLLVSLVLADQALAAESGEERRRIVWAYAETSAADKKALMVANTPQEAEAAAAKLTIQTDKAFQQLAEKKLLDNKLEAYQIHWGLIKPALEANPRDAKIITKLDRFGVELVKAAKGGDCTIVISASKGDGAIVHYAKAHDADLGRNYRQLPGTTTIIHELERAEYKFKSYRDGKETGKTDVIACTDLKAAVKVTITE